MKLTNILIYPNGTRDQNYEYTKRVVEFFTAHGVNVFIPKELSGSCIFPCKSSPLSVESAEPIVKQSAGCVRLDSEIPKEQLDLVIALGGDGTMVRCVHYLQTKDVPVIGVNLGHLGYMTEIDPEYLEDALQKLVDGQFEVERRMMLEASVMDPAGGRKIFYAVNEFVIRRDQTDSLLTVKAYIGKERLGEFRADGVIISSPCGSTAYNFSAGGPILSPIADNMVLTPLCSHSMMDRSLVLRGEDELTFEIEELVRASSALFSSDGRENLAIMPGTKILVRKSQFTFCLAKIGRTSFYEIMQKKMRP